MEAIAEPIFTDVVQPDSHPDVYRLNEERIRLRKWLSTMMEWGRANQRGDKDTAPLTVDDVVRMTERALGTGHSPFD